MYLRPPESLVDVDVAQSRDGALIEERSLDRRAAAFEPLTEAARGERALERLDAEAPVEVRLELAGLQQLPRAEASNVAIAEVRAVVESDNSASMRVVGELSLRSVPKTSRHPKVNQQSAPRVEPQDQILAATLERRHSFALELSGDSERLEGPHEARVVDLDAIEAPAHEVRLELLPDRLDLG
jgi:hypothetical protein